MKKRAAEELPEELSPHQPEVRLKSEEVLDDPPSESRELADMVYDTRAQTWKVKSFMNKPTICTWNVGGLNGKAGLKDLQKFLKEEDPDVLCINETKMDGKLLESHNVKQELSPGKYLQYWNCAKDSSENSGTAILTKVKPIDVEFDMGEKEPDLEGRIIAMEFNQFILVACYAPKLIKNPDQMEYRTRKWDSAFRKYLQALVSSRQKYVVLCGDLNVAHKAIDINNPEEHRDSPGYTCEERNVFSGLLSGGYVDTFRRLHPADVKYTYWNLHTDAREIDKGWRLDYFVISKEIMDSVEESDMLTKVMGSDHCPIKLVPNLAKMRQPSLLPMVKDMEKAAIEAPKIVEEEKEMGTRSVKKTERKAMRKSARIHHRMKHVAKEAPKYECDQG